MTKKMSYEEMYKKGYISEERYIELNNNNIGFNDLKKGQLLEIKLKEDDNNYNFLRQYRLLDNPILRVEIISKNDGINHIYAYNRYGEPLTVYYTINYAIRNNITGDRIKSLVVKRLDTDKILEIGYTRIESIKLI